MSTISLDPQTEKELIMAAQADVKSFAPLYEHYHPHIRRFFSVKLINSDIIDDLTSLTFEKALKNISNFTWQGYSFSAWIYRIANNTLIDFYRKQGSNQFSTMPDDIQVETKEAGPEENLETTFQINSLEKVLKELPDKERKIVLMKFYEGYTNKVIAQKTGLSESNVSTIVHRALQKIRKLLD